LLINTSVKRQHLDWSVSFIKLSSRLQKGVDVLADGSLNISVLLLEKQTKKTASEAIVHTSLSASRNCEHNRDPHLEMLISSLCVFLWVVLTIPARYMMCLESHQQSE
jgi:hypothetical protein